MKSCEPLAFAGPNRAPHLGGLRARPSAPIRLCFFTVRVSRGVSALGPVSSLGLGLALPSRLAANQENEIEIRLSCFCFPTLRQRAPVPASFRFIVTDSSSGVRSVGCCPQRPEICAFHDARRSLRRTVFALGGLLGLPLHATTYL